MLSPADVVTAKLLVQMRALDSERVREALRAMAATPGGGPDLVGHLQEGGLLGDEVAAKIRRYHALFERVRLEAIYLRTVEKRLPAEQSDAISAALAQLEHENYRQRLGQVLVERGLLKASDAASIERKCRSRLQREDLRVLERYTKDDFEGVARPLISASSVTTGVFTVSRLFRSKTTQRMVKKARVELQNASPDPLAASGVLLPPESEDEVELAPQERKEVAAQHQTRTTARLRPGASSMSLPAATSAHPATIGRYRVVRQLGEGSLGAVYLAAAGDGTEVVVKVLPSGDASHEDVLRFKREAKLMRRVNHPRVARLIEAGQEEGRYFIVSTYEAGTDLEERLAAQGSLSHAQCMNLADRLLDGLGALHAAHVVHRDVKPKNVVVIPGLVEDVRLVDFGIARSLDNHLPVEERAFRSRSGVISGSPAYVAPETIAGGVIDARADLYSFGVLFFQLLTGRFPLQAESPYDFLREHLVGVPLTLAQANPQGGYSAGLESFVARLLAKDPGHRPSTCLEARSLLAASR